MNYQFEVLDENNAYDYAYVNSRAWLESYKGIIDDEYLIKINTDDRINELSEILKKKIKKNQILIFY